MGAAFWLALAAMRRLARGPSAGALAIYGSAREAVRSQYAMLALMVVYTLLALALISELAV